MEKEDKVGLTKALSKVLEVVEEEGYCDGWDMGMDLGRSSGSTDAAYRFVDWIVSAYDKTLAQLGPAKNEWMEFDTNFHMFLENFEPLLPFKIDWTNKKPIFEDDDTEEEDD